MSRLFNSRRLEGDIGLGRRPNVCVLSFSFSSSSMLSVAVTAIDGVGCLCFTGVAIGVTVSVSVRATDDVATVGCTRLALATGGKGGSG
jgi:hypothetical protein